jgi:hypothetical protein
MTVNNRRVNLAQPPLFLHDYDSTYIPVRDIFRMFRFTAEWDPETRVATLRNNRTVIEITEGSPYFFKNGMAFRASGPALMIDGTLMMPFKEVLDSIGVTAHRDANNNLFIFHSWS